jgi:hypothetical protein
MPIQIMLPRVPTTPVVPLPSRLHPGMIVLWVTLLAGAGLMLWAAFGDPSIAS